MDYNKSSELLKALGNPIRLAILDNLDEDGCNVNMIVEKLNVPQSTISQHLAILRHTGIVSACKKGYNTCYKIQNSKVGEILKIVEE